MCVSLLFSQKSSRLSVDFALFYYFVLSCCYYSLKEPACMCSEKFLRFSQQSILSGVLRDRGNAPLVSLICGFAKITIISACGCLDSLEEFMSFSVQPKSPNILSFLA